MSLSLTTKTAPSDNPLTFVQKVIGNDTWMVMAQSAVQLEDEYSSLYYTTQNQSNVFLQPPFVPAELKNLCLTNNVLNQCVEAMEVNIDGTGYEFVGLAEGQEPDKAEVEAAEAFFNEPTPGQSFISIRRALRRELETVGYAYLEVLRNPADEVVGLRNIFTHNVRMVKLDAPVMVTKTVTRQGKEVELTMWERERRFAQRVALKQLVYYREFGSTRHVNRNDGRWEDDGSTGNLVHEVKPEERGTELLMFGIHPDIQTPYFVPRWVNQMPSVVGSRKAEELNLEYLDSGGMPPAMIFLQGGTLAKDASNQLKAYLSGLNKNKYRAVVVDVQSNSGSLESTATVQVKVERFGCVDSDTEVLTQEGWLPIKDWSGQAVASLKSEGLVYDQPLAFHSYDYQGYMVKIEGHATEFMVTPNHRVWYERKGLRFFEPAIKTLARSNVRVPVAPTEGHTSEMLATFLVAGADYDAGNFLDFLGMFIADGSTTDHPSNACAINLSVKKQRKKDFLNSGCLQSVAASAGSELKAYECAGGFTAYHLYAPGLREWLRSEVGVGAGSKRIPPMALALNCVQSERLLQALLHGDGHRNDDQGKDGWTYTTVSPRLADDVQRLCLHAGYRSVVSQVKGREEWCVSITPKTFAHVTKEKCPEWGMEYYTGKVWCFTMPTGVFVTRRNGKVCITGNSERMMDSMFGNYDKATEEHVRIGFRLPPLFLGKAADYNFSTAQTAYMVAEEQVFQPERKEFDERITNTIIRGLGLKSLKMKSKPVTLTSATDQIAALTQAKDVASKDTWIKEMNTVTGMELEVSEEPVVPPGVPAVPGQPATKPATPLKVVPPTPTPSPKAKTASELVRLAEDYAVIKGIARKQDIPDARKQEVLDQVQGLSREDSRLLDSLMASYLFGSNDPDLVELAGHVHRH